MRNARKYAMLGMCLLLAAPAIAAEGDTKAREQFKPVVDSFNEHAFETLLPVLDKADLINRVAAVRAVGGQTRQLLNSDFERFAEVGFLFSLHGKPSADSSEVVEFNFENGKGRAVMRFSLPQHTYAYLAFELRHDNRGRLRVVDWFDTRTGQRYTTTLNEILVTMQPTKAATRNLLSLENPTDLQLFQATEALKATRDGQAARFFEIYDDFDDGLKQQALLAKYAVRFAAQLNSPQRFVETLQIFVDIYEDDDNFQLPLSEFFLRVQAYDRAYASLKAFHDYFDVHEGSVPARLSALALAIGQSDDAEKFAAEATSKEPTLELGWWSLLRARAAAGDFAGALEALTALENDFEHRLDAAKLRRDPYRAFGALIASQEFKDWRAARD